MKLRSIRIVNMHNVEDKTYDLSSGFTYFNGPNGAGKSTILEAIQLVILGYIPGYAKTNEAILKHSSANQLQVIGTFDDGSVVTRTWTRSGSSVSADIETVPATLKSNFNIIDSQLELPIYNFNEFKDMTANKLKEWFLSFLPSASNNIDWKLRLIDVLGDRRPILNDELLAETLAKIDELSKNYQGLELVQNLNTHFKSEQSYYKKEIDRLQGTIQSLIFYDEDLPSSEEEVRSSISLMMELLTKLTEYEGKASQLSAIQDKLAQLDKVDVSTNVQDIEDVDAYVEARNSVANAQSEVDAQKSTKDLLTSQIAEIQRSISELSRIKDSTCPYTSKQCSEIQEIIEYNASKISLLKLTLESLQQQELAASAALKESNNKLFFATSALDELKTQYSTFFQLKGMINGFDLSERPTKLTREEIAANLQKCQESLSKIEANKKYNELVETVTADKFKAMNNLEVTKIWAKLTDANGLQTEIMTKPFETLGEDMGRYLSVMFGQPTKAHFNLVGKANSFSFGIIRQDKYIEFDYLSSGERCLFMLAMMICILDKNQTSLRTILVDDLIDHLDDDNAENIYDALSNISDVQFILAGVKSCDAKGVVHI